MLDRYALNFQRRYFMNSATCFEIELNIRVISNRLKITHFPSFLLPLLFFFRNVSSIEQVIESVFLCSIRVFRSLNQTISKESSDENNHLRKNQMPDRFYRLTQTVKLYCYSQLDLRVQMQSEHFKLLTSIPERITNSRSKQPLYSRRNNFSCRQYALASFALSTFERIRDCEFMSNAFMPIEYLTTVCVCVYLCVEGGKVARKKDRFEIFKKNESIF